MKNPFIKGNQLPTPIKGKSVEQYFGIYKRCKTRKAKNAVWGEAMNNLSPKEQQEFHKLHTAWAKAECNNPDSNLYKG